MGGTRIGGIRAAATNKQRYGDDFYVINGSKGGKTPTTKPKGFAALTPEERSQAGHKGGSIGRMGGQASQYDRDAYLQRVKKYAREHQDV